MAQTQVDGCQVAHTSPGKDADLIPLKSLKKKSIAVRNATCVKVPKTGTFNPYRQMGAFEGP